MKVIIFAGGIGTRLWPLSRKNSPKQFDKIFNGKSTLELAIERVEPLVGLENIFIQTTFEFSDAVRNHIPNLPAENIFIEPTRRNVGPAVCYGMLMLQKISRFGENNSHGSATSPNPLLREEEAPVLSGGRDAINRFSTVRDDSRIKHEPVALLWADHLMERVDEFQQALKMGEELINKDPERFIFLAERPRFANNNLGWLKVGERLGEVGNKDYFQFLGWKYKPGVAECDQMFKSGDYYWNPGYFISSIDFILEEYKTLAPEIYEHVKNALENHENALEHYEKAEKISFDRAIIEKTDLSKAVVIKTNMGWSDPGTLYALKEALEKSKDDNITKGNVITLNTKDSLLYNFEEKKLLATVGLEGFVVINMDDALIILPKEEVVNVTKLVDKIGEEGYGQHL